jgi:hypothetical protein
LRCLHRFDRREAEIPPRVAPGGTIEPKNDAKNDGDIFIGTKNPRRIPPMILSGGANVGVSEYDNTTSTEKNVRGLTRDCTRGLSGSKSSAVVIITLDRRSDLLTFEDAYSYYYSSS